MLKETRALIRQAIANPQFGNDWTGSLNTLTKEYGTGCRNLQLTVDSSGGFAVSMKLSNTWTLVDTPSEEITKGLEAHQEKEDKKLVLTLFKVAKQRILGDYLKSVEYIVR